MCVNFFFRQEVVWLSCIYLRWYQALEQIMLLKVFLNRTQRDTIQRQQKLTARLHENGDITEKLVGRCHLQDNAPIV